MNRDERTEADHQESRAASEVEKQTSSPDESLACPYGFPPRLKTIKTLMPLARTLRGP